MECSVASTCEHALNILNIHNAILQAFIKKYVQCYSCGNPETVIKIKKDFISLKCKACGAVSDVDMRHKVNTFILKNPPENKLSKEEKRSVTAINQHNRPLCPVVCNTTQHVDPEQLLMVPITSNRAVCLPSSTCICRARGVV